MKNEKPVVSATGRIDYLNNQRSMKNYKPNKNEFQSNSAQSRQNLFESTKLSRLPKLPIRSKFELPNFTPTSAAVVVFVGCGGRIESDNEFLQSIAACRKCLGVYAVVLGAIEESEQRRRRETLERFVAEVK